MKNIINLCSIAVIAVSIYGFYKFSRFVENSVHKESKGRYEIESQLVANNIITHLTNEIGTTFNENLYVDMLNIYKFESVNDYNQLFSNVIGKQGLQRIFIAERTDNKTERDELLERLNVLYNYTIEIKTDGFIDNSTYEWIQIYVYPPIPTIGLIVNSDPTRSELMNELLTGDPIISIDISTATGERGLITSTPVSFDNLNLTKIAFGQLFDYNAYFETDIYDFKTAHIQSRVQVIIESTVIFDNGNGEFNDFNEFIEDDITIKISNFYYPKLKTFSYVFIPCVIGTILLYLLILEMNRRWNLVIKHKNYSMHFISNISHEMLTPLNGIQGITEIISDDDVCEKHNYYLNTIKSCVNSLKYIVMNVIEQSSLNKGNFRLNLKTVNISEILVKCLHDSWVTYRDKNKDLDFMINVGSIPRECICDGDRVIHIFSNIISNAIRFTESGRIHVNILADIEKTNNFLFRCEVKDTGIGIENKIKEDLFTNSGNGIGLSVSKKMAKLMRGDVFCVSTEIGTGSTFMLTFKGDCTQDKFMEPCFSTFYKSEKDETNETNDLEHDNSNSAKVLIVDDVSVNRMVLGHIMTSIGVHFDCCINGLQAFEKCQNVKYKAIFMDNMMPIMGGEEATQKIRKKSLNIHTPIIFVSANVQPIVIERCLQSGGNIFLGKPVNKNTVISVLK